MMKRLLVMLACFLAVGNASGQSSLPSQTPFCQSEKEAAYEQGYEVGFAAGVGDGQKTCQQQAEAGYQSGVSDGMASGISQCQGDPASCNISLGSVLAEGGYGETEPNDNMISADALLGGAKFTGQTYGPADEDWFFLVTSEPNQILTVYFSVPWRDPATSNVSDWKVEVRDAAGNLYATFGTDFIAGNPNGDDEIAYPVTLGLVGTYYVVVKPALGEGNTPSAYPYQLAVLLQASDLDNPPLVVNFFDAEVEPNNLHTQANPLATGVAMYGLINLRFDSVVTDENGENATYGQGEPDWFVYQTAGDEIVTLSFCDREVCEAGDWLVQVFDAQGAALADGGGDPTPLVAFNTGSGLGWPDTVHFGLTRPGSYYMRVNHKRKFDAPCRAKVSAQECLNTQGICSENSCGITQNVTNPEDPDGIVGLGCSCEQGSTSCRVTIDEIQGLCNCADKPVENCGLGIERFKGVCWEQKEVCVEYGGIVEIPQDEVTAQYNFTWFGSKITPFTVDTPAYELFQQRPSWFNK